MTQYSQINALLREKQTLSDRIQRLASEMNELAVQREKIRDRIDQLCCTLPPSVSQDKTTKTKKQKDSDVLKALVSAMKNDPGFMQRVESELKKRDQA